MRERLNRQGEGGAHSHSEKKKKNFKKSVSGPVVELDMLGTYTLNQVG